MRSTGVVIGDAVARRIVTPLRWSHLRLGFGTQTAGHRDGMARRRAAQARPANERGDGAVALLRAAVRAAGDTVPFWRERSSRLGFDWRAPFTLADHAAALPPLERREIAEAGDGLIPEAADRSRPIADATGGSTGEPLRIRLDPYERGFIDAGAEWHYQTIGHAPGRRTALLYGGEVDPLARPSLARRARNWATNVLAFSCFRLDADSLEAVHGAFDAPRLPVVANAFACGDRPLAGFEAGAITVRYDGGERAPEDLAAEPAGWRGHVEAASRRVPTASAIP
jgi:hypothetical protein